MRIILIFLHVFTFIRFSNSLTHERTEQILNQLLSKFSSSAASEAKIPPPDPPVQINVNFYILSIETVSEMKMEYTMQMYFRMAWHDSRLTYEEDEANSTSPLIGSWELVKKIWTPDLFFRNEKHGHIHDLMKPNLFIKIHPNGSVMQSTRISITLSCPMNLRFYPMDIQNCPLAIESYGYSSTYIRLSWNEIDGPPIYINKNIMISNFRIQEVTHRTQLTKVKTGEYSALLGDFIFVREFSYYLIGIYLPCGMIVIISWVSFWLGDGALDARIGLGITTILTMVTQIYGIAQTAPPVPYIKALDVWTGCCMGFVVLTILEVSIVSVIARRRRHGTRAVNSNGPIREHGFRMQNESAKINKMDLISMFLFPIGFTLFNISYWSAYLLQSQQLNSFT